MMPGETAPAIIGVPPEGDNSTQSPLATSNNLAQPSLETLVLFLIGANHF